MTLLLWHAGLTASLTIVLLLVTLSRAIWDRLLDRRRRHLDRSDTLSAPCLLEQADGQQEPPAAMEPAPLRVPQRPQAAPLPG